MILLLLEASLALALFIFILWWTLKDADKAHKTNNLNKTDCEKDEKKRINK